MEYGLYSLLSTFCFINTFSSLLSGSMPLDFDSARPILFWFATWRCCRNDCYYQCCNCPVLNWVVASLSCLCFRLTPFLNLPKWLNESFQCHMTKLSLSKLDPECSTSVLRFFVLSLLHSSNIGRFDVCLSFFLCWEVFLISYRKE